MYIGPDIQNKFPLSPLKPIKKTVGKIFFLTIIVIAASIYFLIENPIIVIPILLGFIVGSALIYFYEYWYYKTYRYDLTDDFIIIKKGPIAPQEITIAYERIQDVYLDQDLLDSFFGLYDIHISTATVTSGMRAHIDGVDRETALGLREIILKKIIRK